MSATNHTANYELSQYIGSDEPKYLTDYNGDMSKIDTAIKGVDTKAETANTGVATNASAISALDTAVGSLNTQVATVASVANGNTGSINTINSLIGNGEPTTQDKTIIGAINEIDARTGDADGIDFDNAGTGLVATNVQDAIEEVNAKIPQGGSVDADDVAYDNTSTGLTATNVQDAIDEVDGKFGGSQIRYDSTSQAMQYSSDGGTTWSNFKGALSIDEVETSAHDIDSKTATGAQTMGGTETYTVLADHDELLIIADCTLRGFPAANSTYANEVTVSTNNQSSVVAHLHNNNDVVWGAVGGATGFENLDRNAFTIKDVKAGDVLTFTYTGSFSNNTQTGYLTGFYNIFTIN